MRYVAILAGAVALAGCKNDDDDDAPEPDRPHAGDPCEPEAPQDEPELTCAEGLACETVSGTDDHVCAAALEIRGQVIDSVTLEPIEGATVAALDETNSPVTNVARTDACGDYVLTIAIERDPAGELIETPVWTLSVAAPDHLAFPSGIRPALPVSAADAVIVEEEVSPDPESSGETGIETLPHLVIENAATTIALIPLDEADAGGATVTGSVEGVIAPGTLVVAEGGTGRSPYAIADASGDFVLFNVPADATTIRGYRVDLELEPAPVGSVADVDGVVLSLITEDPAQMGRVEGSVNIVNAPGGSLTSVVLVPVSLFDPQLERGPVPLGLRSPPPPKAPDVSSGFAITGVPAGDYQVLAAFENDDLVRDPDDSIAGTAIQAVSLKQGDFAVVDESFKVTEHLRVIAPGADEPEAVSEPPDLVWADDSSEDRYELQVFDALGNLVWEDLEVPGVSGGDTVTVAFGESTLTNGMYYQFRVTSFRDTPQGTSAIARTEDLRGVFVFGDPDAMMPAACEIEDGATGGG